MVRLQIGGRCSNVKKLKDVLEYSVTGKEKQPVVPWDTINSSK